MNKPKLTTLNVQPDTKDAFHNVKRQLLLDLDKNMSDDETLSFLFSKLKRELVEGTIIYYIAIKPKQPVKAQPIKEEPVQEPPPSKAEKPKGKALVFNDEASEVYYNECMASGYSQEQAIGETCRILGEGAVKVVEN